MHNCLVLRWTFRRRQWHPTPVLLPGKSHGWRSLVGCSPWGLKESDTTERLLFHFSLSHIGEGNGNPLQCSCLENPRDKSLVGCRLWGRTESDTTDVTQQQGGNSSNSLQLGDSSGVLLLLLSPLSRFRLLATPLTAAYQAPPSMGFSRQEYWSGVPLPSPKWCLRAS